ncbi:MAG: hypothetical protein GX322_02350 [Firmicutes bacterium]|nr:hypothetical protein [Bacillota bacterium]
MLGKVKLLNVPAPINEIPKKYPRLPLEIYKARLQRLRDRMKSAGLDKIIIYADREHAANFSYLTGFGPRFEEALLIVGLEGTPTAVLGTENINMIKYTSVELEGVHYPTFSLIGQPREDVLQLTEILEDAGLQRGMSVGTVGWKYYGEQDGCPAGSFEIPHFIIHAIESLVGDRINNATGIFMSPYSGLRTVLELEEIIVFEYAASLVARSMLAMMDSVAVGKTELELASAFQNMGVPLSVHPMLSVGEKARFGLVSPGDNKAKLGDFLTAAYGIEGALSCRAAFIATGPHDLDPDIQDWLSEIAIPFFSTATQWLETIAIGVEGGEIWDLAETRLPKDRYRWNLNPGHFIAADEWVSTPFTPDSKVKLQSGNYMQFDLIVAPAPPYFGSDLEDGLVLADEKLRSRMKDEFPEVWARFQRRRRYIQDVLEINLREEVMPMSDILGYYRPFLLNPDLAFVIR